MEEYLGERAHHREEVRRNVEARFDPSGIRATASGPGAELTAMLLYAAAEDLSNETLRALRHWTLPPGRSATYRIPTSPAPAERRH